MRPLIWDSEGRSRQIGGGGVTEGEKLCNIMVPSRIGPNGHAREGRYGLQEAMYVDIF